MSITKNDLLKEKPKSVSKAKQLLEIKVGDFKLFPISKYGYLNSLISKRFNKNGIYFSLENLGKEVKVTRLKRHPQIKRKPGLLAMQIEETYIEHVKHYEALHVIVTRLNKEGVGEWSCMKVGDMAEIKRIS